MRFKNSLKIKNLVDQFLPQIEGTSGPLDVEILHFCEPNSKEEGGFAFINKPEMVPLVESSKVRCALAPLKLRSDIENSGSKKTWIFTKNPELLARNIKNQWVMKTPYQANHKGVHTTSIISKGVSLGKNVTIGPYVVIEEACHIGQNCFIGAHAVIEANTTLGSNTTVHPHAYIGHSCVIGDNCEIMPQAVIGSEGFGYVHDHLGNHYRIPHTGRVILENDVHIGAGTAIDRGTIGDTIIRKGSKIDNQVHLAHNTVLGKNGIITAQVVTAGSTTIGDNFVAGGKTAITGHIKITDNVSVAGFSGISKSIDKPGRYGGYPLLPLNEFLKVKASSVHIVELRKQVSKLMKKVFPESN